MTEAAITGWGRVWGGLRAIIRQIAAAVYVSIGGALISWMLIEHEWVLPAVAPLLTLLAGFVLGKFVKGPWWTTHLVGVVVSVLHVAIALVVPIDTEEPPSYLSLAIGTVLVTGAGILGAWLAQRKDRQRSQT